MTSDFVISVVSLHVVVLFLDQFFSSFISLSTSLSLSLCPSVGQFKAVHFYFVRELTRWNDKKATLNCIALSYRWIVRSIAAKKLNNNGITRAYTHRISRLLLLSVSHLTMQQLHFWYFSPNCNLNATAHYVIALHKIESQIQQKWSKKKIIISATCNVEKSGSKWIRSRA